MFINMLLKAVNTGEVTAFEDDRFTTPMTLSDIQQLLSVLLIQLPRYDPNDTNKDIGYVVTRASFDPKTCYKAQNKGRMGI